MCCSVTVKPFDRKLAETILAVGLFEVNKTNVVEYVRDVPEEHSLVAANFNDHELRLTIRPAINNMQQHIGKRVTASIMFEIAWRYAEKLGSDAEIWQLSNIGECLVEHGTNNMIAKIGLKPFQWNDVCLGFRREILGLTT